jgi:poly-gamma-glutamate synthesis protein (capsule biosynthesis protein)
MKNGIQKTIAHMHDLGITTVGAGRNTFESSQPVQFDEYVLLAFGWAIIGCESSGISKPGVNRLVGKRVLHQARKAVKEYPGKKIVVIMHWNYEFELYPQPGHRKLAHELIDLGIYAVIGHHPHIVSPIERYKERTIAYSLGNWAFSQNRFFNGKLRFPNESYIQVALDISSENDVIHHALFEPPSTIAYLNSEEVTSNDFSLRAVFEGMSHNEYIKWFALNRRKTKLLPIYKNYAGWSNSIRDLWVLARQVIIDNAVKSGLKSTNRRI